MDYDKIFTDLTLQFPDIKIFRNHPLAPYTTLRIGGPADIFIHPATPDQLISILNFVHQYLSASQIPLTVLGNGSNVLISDTGIRGIVIKNSSQNIKVLSETTKDEATNFSARNHPNQSAITARRTENDPQKYLDFTRINYDESDSPPVLVKLSSGTPLPYAINYLISQGITGLQWFAYIPGTIGGAVWYNIHGGSYHFSDFIQSIEVFDLKSGQIKTFNQSDLTWGYDHSFFQSNPALILLSITLRLYHGDAARAKATASAWIAQKAKVQSMNSAGSVFKNPSLEDCTRLWGEQKSTGWIIDHELNWKGKKLGGAQISPDHANFILNTGSATAADYFALAGSVQSEVLRRFGLKLEMEVKLLGDF